MKTNAWVLGGPLRLGAPGPLDKTALGKGYLTEKWKFGQKGAWPRSRDLLFKFCYPANISGTAADNSRATSNYHDLLNKQATEALELGKIRESIALTSNTVTKCDFVNFLEKKKQKLISKTEHQFNTLV